MAPSAALPLLLLGCAPTGPRFGLSRADGPIDELVFNNGAEPEFLDPTQATGHPDSRVIGAMFDGLTEYHPEDLSPQPGLAERWEVHPDGRGYTFHLRHDAVWSDGEPITAHDVVWSWEHVLHPVFLSRYAQQLYMVERAEPYNQGRVFVLREDVDGVPAGTAVLAVDTNLRRLAEGVTVGGTAVEAGATVLLDAPGSTTAVVQAGCVDASDLPALVGCEGARSEGTVAAEALEPTWPVRGQRVLSRAVDLLDDQDGVRASLPAGTEVVVLGEPGGRAKVQALQAERAGWVPADALVDPHAGRVRYRVEVLPELDWEGDDPPSDAGLPVEPRLLEVDAGQLRTDVAALGLRIPDDHTLVVRLRGTAPYFLTLTSHTTLRPAPRRAWEAHGSRWTRPEHIVTSGPFRLVAHEVRDRFEFERNEDWWGVGRVALRKVTAYSIDNLTTSANLYRAGYTDLVVANDLPSEFIPILEDKEDYAVGPSLAAYFYRLNTTRPELQDPRVRRALSMAIDRRDIVKVTKAGQLPASHLVPPGLPGYGDGVAGPSFDPEAARALLAEAGYPGGQGFPEISILYNTLESHKLIAAVVQAQWKEHLGIAVQLENREWKTYLKAVHAKDYDVARAGWIGDFVDPLTFLELFITDGGNNETGWSDPEYDRLIYASSQTPDPEERMAILRKAEALLNEAMPIIPIYTYVNYALTQPDVKGWHANVLDQHPWQVVSLDR
ncbi:MAG: peptide ABC transporter substrate-binding protein [Alphaproteobacteria bacterium]|nr:peptide ABC transporter substrate-binding protein [Alphaproteobacteria bacterium]